MDRSRRTYPIELYSATYKVEGLYQPLGALLSAINDPERGYFYLSDVLLAPLRAGSPLRPAQIPQAGFGKRDIGLVCFQDENVAQEMHLLQRVERMIVYTPAFALRGNFHLGAEQRLRDMLDTVRGRFQPMTGVTIFPLIETSVSVPRQASVLLVNKDLVQVYYPEPSPTRGTA